MAEDLNRDEPAPERVLIHAEMVRSLAAIGPQSGRAMALVSLQIIGCAMRGIPVCVFNLQVMRQEQGAIYKQMVNGGKFKEARLIKDSVDQTEQAVRLLCGVPGTGFHLLEAKDSQGTTLALQVLWNDPSPDEGNPNAGIAGRLERSLDRPGSLLAHPDRTDELQLVPGRPDVPDAA